MFTITTYLKDEDSTLLGKIETQLNDASEVNAHIEKMYKLEKVIENVNKNEEDESEQVDNSFSHEPVMNENLK